MSTICKYCHEKDSIIEDYTTGEEVCVKCGTIYSENIIYDEYKIRTLGTETKLKVKPKEKIQVSHSLSQTRKLYNNSQKIRDVLSKAGVSRILIEKTLDLFFKIAPKKNIQGKKFKHFIIALYYYASRVEGYAQTFKELAKMFPPVTERQIRTAFNIIKVYVVDNESDDE